MFSISYWILGLGLIQVAQCLRHLTEHGVFVDSPILQDRAASQSNTKVLKPAVHWDHDLSDYNNLKPQGVSKMYYAETAGLQSHQQGHMFLKMNSTWLHPTVVLAHTHYITSISCSHNATVEISFSNAKAFSIAEKSWTGLKNLVLVSESNICSHSRDERAYWLASSTSFQATDSSWSVIAVITELHTQRSFTEADLAWGTWVPAKRAAIKRDATKKGRCGEPPSCTMNGFPAAACGPNFDKTLDNALGYIPINLKNYKNAIQPFVPGLAKCPERRLAKRGWALFDAITEAVSAVIDAVAVAAQTAVEFVTENVAAAVNDVGDAVDTATAYIADATSWLPSVGPFDMTIALVPYPTVLTSDFGSVYEIYTEAGVGIYCVDCSVTGGVNTAGQASFNLVDGVKALSTSMVGNIHAGLVIGMSIGNSWSKEWEKNLFTYGLPGLSVPNVIAIGPSFSLDAQLGIALSAGAVVKAGVTMDFPNIDVLFDFVNTGSNTAGGFTPTVNQVFTVTGAISASAGIFIPVSINFGVTIPAINYDKKISLVEKPGVSLTATYDTTYGDACSGVAYAMTATNDVSMTIFDALAISISTWSYPLAAGCITLPSGQASPARLEIAATNITNATAPAGVGVNATSLLQGTYGSLVDITNKVALYANPPDGDVYLTGIETQAGTQFWLKNQLVVSDESYRYLHYYPDVMKAYNVSRVKLSDAQRIPKTSEIIFFAPVNVSTPGLCEKPVYTPIDSMGNHFIPVFCNMDGQHSKMFIARDMKAAKALKKSELMYTVTGGYVSNCSFIPFVLSS